MTGYLYILKDERGKFYIGSTGNLEVRLKQHKYGQTYTTKRMMNPILVLSQKFASIVIARQVERKLKRMKRKDYIEKMVDDGYIKLV